jgi:ribosomal protein L29
MVRQANTKELRAKQNTDLVEDLKKLKVKLNLICLGRITKY